MTSALYYPWIEIRDDGWLKTALLYWDAIRTIVPESVERPYRSAIGRQLEQAGFLVPLRVHSGMYEIEALATEALGLLATREAGEFLLDINGDRQRTFDPHNLPGVLGLGVMHPDKLPWVIRDRLQRLSARTESDWLSVPDTFANYYMTLLATRLSERLGISVVTPLPSADSLAAAARFDAQVEGLISLGLNVWRPPDHYGAFGRPLVVSKDLAPGLLAQLAIERIAVAPDTPVDRLLAFRERHRDELALFQAKIAELASIVKENQPLEAMRQRVVDMHATGVVPALANLSKALGGQRIKAMVDGLVRVAFLSTGSSSMLVATGLSVPMALLAGAGVSLVVARALYNVARRESLQTSPFTYLLTMSRELSPSAES